PDLYVTQPAGGPVVLAGDATTQVTSSYKLSLGQKPADGTKVVFKLGHDPVLALSSSDPRFDAATQTVTFDSTNYTSPITITITAVDDGADGDAENTLISTITHTIDPSTTDPAYLGLVAPGVDVKVVSDDVAGVLLTPTDASGNPDGSTLVD